MKLNYQVSCGCKNSKKKKIFTYTKPPLLEQNYSIKDKYLRYFFQCNICGHMFGVHEMNWDPKFYHGQYFKSTYEDEKKLSKRFNFVKKLSLKNSDNKNRVNRINSIIKSKNYKLLDIGSGIGIFLYEMKKKKWNVTGIETDKNFVNFANKKYKLNVNCVDLFKFKNKKKFDLITFNKVLEHVKFPIKMLNFSKNFLKSNGIIYIELPSISAKKNGKNREEFFIEHHQVFSKDSLKYLLNKARLVPILLEDIIEPSGKFTIYCFAKKI